jgi:hypothetical protein
MLCLLQVPEDEAERLRREIIGRDRRHVPGALRASLGIYNDESDVDALCDCLKMVAERKYAGKYEVRRESGAYAPVGKSCFDFKRYFSFD